MASPVPPAPEGFEEPIWRHDTIDVMVVVDRQDRLKSPEEEPVHPIDKFVAEVSRTLEVVGNHPTLVLATDEIRYEEELPTAIFAVITNDERYARWCRSWGGNVIEIAADGSDVVLSAGERSGRFGPDQLVAASLWTRGEVERPPEPGDDGGRRVQIRPLRFVSRLDDPDRLSVARNGIETMLSELQRMLMSADLGVDVIEAAQTLSEHLLGYYRMESPPPIEAVDGAMTAAARLIHENRPPTDFAELDEALRRLIEPRTIGEAAAVVEPLEATLEVAGEAGRLARLRGETLKGLADVYRKLVSGAVVAGGAIAIDGLHYLATNRSYISALVEWLFGATI